MREKHESVPCLCDNNYSRTYSTVEIITKVRLITSWAQTLDNNKRPHTYIIYIIKSVFPCRVVKGSRVMIVIVLSRPAAGKTVSPLIRPALSSSSGLWCPPPPPLRPTIVILPPLPSLPGYSDTDKTLMSNPYAPSPIPSVLRRGRAPVKR